MKSSSLICICAFGFIQPSLMGCSSGVKPIPSATISGNVTLDGSPLADGAINFSPADGKTPSAGSKIIGGKYSAIVPKGQMKVLINSVKVTGQKKVYNTPDSPMTDERVEIIPKQYNLATTLTHDVNANKSDLNFDLTSK